MKSRLLVLAALFSLASCAPAVSSSKEPNSSTVVSSSQDQSSSSSVSSEEESSCVAESSLESSWSSSTDEVSSLREDSSEDYLPVLEHDSVWNPSGALDGLRGESFLTSLASRIVSTGSKTCSYSGLWDYLDDSDKSPDGKIRPFYHAPSEGASKGSCNREHVWPDSRGAGKSGPGSDPHVIRPALSSENSSRGNKYFGPSSREFDPASLGYEGARGEAARIIFYAATRYAKSHGLSLDNNPGASTAQKTMGSLKTLLEWNRKYPVNEAEILRNNVLDDFGFARNPFIDNPSFAEYIWDDDGFRGENGNIDSQTGELHRMVTDVTELQNGKSFFIGALDATSFIAMTKDYSPNTPWYVKGAQISTPVDGEVRTDLSSISYWTLEAASGGYKMRSSEGYLYGYNDGTFNSICYNAPTSPTATSSSDVWDVSIASDGKLTLKAQAATPVYLEFYNSSFCGFKREGSIPLYAYAK